MPFVSLAGPDLVNDLACCKDPAIVSCVAASILPSALGKQGSIELPNNIVLKYAGNEGGNKRSYSYLGGEGMSGFVPAIAALIQVCTVQQLAGVGR